MAWTYDVSLDQDKDRVRLLIGDTDTADQQLQNEEISFLLDTESNVYRAASAACRALAARYARKTDKEVGDLKIKYQQRQKSYADLAKMLYARGGYQAIPSAGGVLQSDKDAAAANGSLVQPAFRVGIHDL